MRVEFSHLINKVDLITIPPDNSTEINDYFNNNLNIYLSPSKIDYNNFLVYIHKNIQKWILKNFPTFEPNAVQLCTYHLATNYAMLYISSQSVARNIVNLHGNKEEYSLILDYNLFNIPGDWHTPLISLIATIEFFSENDIKFKLLSTDNKNLYNLLNLSNYNYLPFKILISNDSEGFNLFYKEIEKSNFISIHQTYRNSIFSAAHNSIFILPKSNLISSNYLGNYNQFNYPYKVTTTLNYDWSNFSISKSDFSKSLECLYFNAIGNIVLPSIFDAEYKFFNIFNNSNNLQELNVEEILDIESLALVSAASKAGKLISISQHSIDSNPKALIPYSSNNCIAKKIYANNNYNMNLYSKIINKEHVVLVHHFEKIKYLPNKKINNTIIIIENDFFRKF